MLLKKLLELINELGKVVQCKIKQKPVKFLYAKNQLSEKLTKSFLNYIKKKNIYLGINLNKELKDGKIQHGLDELILFK